MAPSVTGTHETSNNVKDVVEPEFGHWKLPDLALQRMQKAGIDLSRGYPEFPPKIETFKDVFDLQPEPVPFTDAGTRADPEKKALFSAAKEVRHLGFHCGTEIVGLQLKDLTDKQKDELALLIAERGVVFFRDQDLTPQQQAEVTAHFGKIFPQNAHVPGVPEVSVIWSEFFADTVRIPTYRTPFQGWHTDIVHLKQNFGVTHLHYDTVPPFGGDILWASGYAAYSKLSPAFREFIDGKEAVMRSGFMYVDQDHPEKGPQPYTAVHPIVRVHPATGWKSLYVNTDWVVRIIGLEKAESDMIIRYLVSVYENNVDIQCRWQWSPGSSALWDNRVTLHTASWDFENRETRHGTRVATVAEAPYFDKNAPTMRVSKGLPD